MTIFGQSAGAESIACHMTNPVSDELFHQAILESNPFGLPFRDLKDAQELANLFAGELSCEDIDCLRTKYVLKCISICTFNFYVVLNPNCL